MADKLSGAGLVKNPLFWLSIVAIVAVLLCLLYIFTSSTQKRQHTSNSTIDIKHVDGKDDKQKFDDKKFLKEVLAEVDKKMEKEKKDREDNDKKIDDKMKKLEDEIKKLKEDNQKSLDDLKEQMKPIIDEVIEEQFKAGASEAEDGPKMQMIKDIIWNATDQAFNGAKHYADEALINLNLQPHMLKEPLAEVLKEYIKTLSGDISQQPEPDKKLFAMISAAITKTLQTRQREVQIDVSERPGEKYIVSSLNAKKIGRLMDNLNVAGYDDTIQLPNVQADRPAYNVTRRNVKQVFPSLALVTLQHPLLYTQGQ